MRRAGIAAVCLTMLAGALSPQDRIRTPGEVRIRGSSYAPPGVTIAVQANLLELAATIRDREGRTAGGFTVADFELLDNGKPRPITLFSEVKAPRPPEANPPGAAIAPAAAQPPRTGAATLSRSLLRRHAHGILRIA